MTEVMDSHAELVATSGVLAKYGVASPEVVRSVLQQNLGGTEVSSFDLDRIRVPGAGSVTWEIPGLDGTTPAREFEGIIIAWSERRRFYQEAYQPGAKSPPDCNSEDCVNGIGEPGGPCKTCPYNEWGSATGPDGQATRGKACGQYRMLFVNLPGNILPTVVVVPPSSLGPIRKYFLRLSSRSTFYYGVVTKFRLEPGDPVATVSLSVAEALSPEQQTAIGKYAEKVAPIFSRTTLADEDVQ